MSRVGKGTAALASLLASVVGGCVAPESGGVVSPPSVGATDPVGVTDPAAPAAGPDTARAGETTDYGVRHYARDGSTARDVLDCSRFDSPETAQRIFLILGGPISDPNNLDGDGDGFACEYDPRRHARVLAPVPADGSGCTYVKSHTRRDGTHVSGHRRCR